MHSQDKFYNSYIKPFRLVEQLQLKCGYEKSFKLIDRQLLRNRYLLGIEKSTPYLMEGVRLGAEQAKAAGLIDDTASDLDGQHLLNV